MRRTLPDVPVEARGRVRRKPPLRCRVAPWPDEALRGAPAEARERRAAKRTVNPAAEKAFLAGLYHLERSLKAQLLTGPEQMEVLDSAIEHLEDAITLDPRWSVPLAYA